MKSLSSRRASTSRLWGVPLTLSATGWRSVDMRALGCGSQSPPGEHAREMALIVLAGMHIAVGVDRILCQRRGLREVGCRHAPADQRPRRVAREHRFVAGAAVSQ